MIEKKTGLEKTRKRVRLFLSLDPPKFIEGTITVPNPVSRLSRVSDTLNDERTFLPIQDVATPDGWLYSFPKFVLLNKNEIKAIVEVD
jgi:hypothetical protein